MVREMRDRMVWHLQRPDDPPLLADFAFGAATADSISTAFFGMCQLLLPHEEDERKTAVRLRNLVGEEVKLRNDVAHGDWYIGWISHPGGSAEPQLKPPWVERIKPTRNKGPMESISEDLDARSEKLEELTQFLREYGLVCFGVHGRQLAGQSLGVRDVVCLVDSQPAYGPKAVGWHEASQVPSRPTPRGEDPQDSQSQLLPCVKAGHSDGG